MTWKAEGVSAETEAKFLGDFVKEHISPLIRMEQDQADQAKLRQQYPALKTAWDRYQMLLTMVRSNNPDVDPETFEGR